MKIGMSILILTVKDWDTRQQLLQMRSLNPHCTLNIDIDHIGRKIRKYQKTIHEAIKRRKGVIEWREILN